MKIALPVAVLWLLIPLHAEAREHSKLDFGLLMTSELWLTTDMLQTVNIQRIHHNEANPILGRTPSDLAIVSYFGAAMVLTYLAYEFLPPPWRELVLIGVNAVEIYSISTNINHGIGLSIPFRF